ncbi:hypothetical protein O181_087941 [Austropuccinia psidii MF-1]|uniref:Integrase catalytic domain-containing protein n=1 Tax=Austropuccinia psidii MF-1 TaxID=1389203 RepID=A0A9Q3P6C1_9BASI|nr:hypothetical protein [Austropuccinia psidii MF-1]
MENIHDQTQKRFVSDRGGEFLNHQFKKLSEEWDLNTSCHWRKLLNIMDLPKEPIKPYSKKARCLLNSSNIPNYYWAEAVNTATLLSNLIHTPSRHNLSPHQLCEGFPSCIKKLRVFGSVAEVVDETHTAEVGMVDEIQPIKLDPDGSSRLVDESLASSESGASDDADLRPATTPTIKVIGP